jgi:hypothetical protein
MEGCAGVRVNKVTSSAICLTCSTLALTKVYRPPLSNFNVEGERLYALV